MNRKEGPERTWGETQVPVELRLKIGSAGPIIVRSRAPRAAKTNTRRRARIIPPAVLPLDSNYSLALPEADTQVTPPIPALPLSWSVTSDYRAKSDTAAPRPVFQDRARDRFRRQRTAHHDAEERKILLRERAIEFHVVRLIQLQRAHVADHSDNFDRHAPARDQQRLADRVLIAKHSFRAGFADDDDVRMIHHVLFVEVAASDERNAGSPEPARHDVVRRRAFPLRDGRHIPFRARIERGPHAARQRKIAAQHHLLESQRGA